MVGFTEPRKHTGSYKYPRTPFLNSPSSYVSLIQQQIVSTHADIRNIQFIAQYMYNKRPHCIQNFNAKPSDLNLWLIIPAGLRVRSSQLTSLSTLYIQEEYQGHVISRSRCSCFLCRIRKNISS